MTTPKMKPKIYKILKAWEYALDDVGQEIELDDGAIRTAAAILLVGAARSDKDIETICSVLWSLWEENKDAVQGMQ